MEENKDISGLFIDEHDIKSAVHLTASFSFFFS